MIDEKPPIGAEEVAEATAILQKYKAGKAALDKRIVDNELWFRMGHWKNYQNPMMEGKPQPSSGWLFNSIANKHADAMDNYPSPNVLPRAEDDEAAAQALSSVLPVVLEQADYEQVYSDTWWRKLKTGTGVKGIFWDPVLRGGLGDISIQSVNLLMLYWAPGVEDIQQSPHLFSLSLEDNEQLVGRFPQMEGHTGKGLDVGQYIHDDSIDTTDKSVVRIVSDAVIGEDTTNAISGTAKAATETVNKLTGKAEQTFDSVSQASSSLSSTLDGASNFLSGVSNGNAGNMLGNFFSNLAHGRVSGLSIVGLIAGAFLVFGRTGWLGKIAGIFLTMMMIGNNTQRQQEASVTDNQRQARPQQEQEEQTHSEGMRR